MSLASDTYMNLERKIEYKLDMFDQCEEKLQTYRIHPILAAMFGPPRIRSISRNIIARNIQSMINGR